MDFLDYLMPPGKRDRDENQRLTNRRMALLRGEEPPPEGLVDTVSGMFPRPQDPNPPRLPPIDYSRQPAGGEIPVPDVGSEFAYTGGASGSWGPPAKAPGGPKVLTKTLGGSAMASQGQSGPGGAATAPGGAAAATPPGQPGDSEIARLQRQYDEAMAAQDKLLTPPDRMAMEEAFKRRSSTAGGQLTLALLAKEAGLGEFSAQHLKQAAEARAPMKMAGGTMTETGFIEDPAYQQELTLRRADGRLKQIDAALQGALTRQERARLEKERLQAQKDMQAATIQSQQFIASQASADRRFAADLAHQDRVAARTGKGGKGAGVPSQAETEDVLKQIEGLLPHSTGSYIGAGADQAARAFGYATKGAKAGSAIGPLSARILMSVERFEGPQSEKDVAVYKEAAGDLANTTLPIEQRQAAIQTIRYLNQKYGGPKPVGGGGGGGNVINYSDL